VEVAGRLKSRLASQLGTDTHRYSSAISSEKTPPPPICPPYNLVAGPATDAELPSFPL